MTREQTLRSLSYSFGVDYSTVSDLADVLHAEDDFSVLMRYLERAESLREAAARIHAQEESYA